MVTYPFHLVTSRSRPPDPHGIPTPEHSPHSQQARIAKHSFMPKTIKDWNSLPDSIVNITDNIQFKEALKVHLTTKQE